jgi:hypothetical protein
MSIILQIYIIEEEKSSTSITYYLNIKRILWCSHRKKLPGDLMMTKNTKLFSHMKILKHPGKHKY